MSATTYPERSFKAKVERMVKARMQMLGNPVEFRSL